MTSRYQNEPPADDKCHGRCGPYRDWFAWECRGLMVPEESHNVLDMILNRLATQSSTAVSLSHTDGAAR